MASVLYDPFDPSVRTDPYPAYHAMRTADPVTFHPGAGAWFLSRHADCAAVLRDARFSAQHGQAIRRRADALPASMLSTDPPEHTRLRRCVQTAFHAKAVAHVGEHVHRTAKALVAGWGPEVDGVADFAVPVAVDALCALLGVADGDRDRFGRWAAEVAPQLDPLAPPAPGSRAEVALEELLGWFADVLGERRAAPGHDVLGAIVRAHRAGDLAPDEALTTCSLLVIGGYAPLVDALSNGLWLLAGRADPVTPAVVEEGLRFDSPIQFAARVPVEDVSLGGRVLEAGTPVVTLLGAANRDPARFPEPDAFSPERHPNPHLAFGAGSHRCLGAGLARLVSLRALAVVPGITLAGEPVRHGAFVPRGLATLPLRVSDG